MDKEQINSMIEDLKKVTGSDDGFKTDNMWIPLFLSMLFMGSGNTNPEDLEMLKKEVAYLHGKVDMLTEVVVKKEE